MKWSFEGYEELYESDLMVINGGDSTGSSSGGGATTPVAPTTGSSSGGGATTTPPTSPPTSSTPGSTSGGGSSTPYSPPTGSSTTAGATTPYTGPAGSTAGSSGASGSISTGSATTPYTPPENGTGGTYSSAVLASDEALHTAILVNSDQKYISGSNDCDIWVKKNLDAIGAHVNGLTNPQEKNCETEKTDLIAANPNALTSETSLTIGQTYVGCNEGHMFFVTRTASGQYLVADMTKDTGISGYRPDGVLSQANFDSYFGNNNNGAVYVPIYKN